ncbi:MAG: TIGR03086 family metal-binding protein [Acidimicrobiia bacterium]
MSEATDRIKVLISGFDARMEATPADAWDNQSPCAEWKARNVVEHVANNFLRFGGALSGTTHPPMGADESPAAAWARAKEALVSQLDTADLSAVIPGPFGPMPAEQLIGRILATDLLVHTWDLARAVGGDESLPADIVEGAYSGLKPLDAMLRQSGVFGPKVDVEPGADLQTEFLAFVGRRS